VEATIISPYVTTYSPDAFINVDAGLVETATVTGIDRVFEITLSEAEAQTFLEGFTVSGVTVDCRLARKDINWNALAVSMDASAGTFTTLLEKVIDEAVDGSGAQIDKYLSTQLYNAFTAAFSSYLPAAYADSGSVDASGWNGADIAAAAVTTAGSEAEANLESGTVAVGVATAITGFSVDVLTDKAAAANALQTQHNLNAGAMASMFRQCGRERILEYLAAGANGAAETLYTDALPLYKGDSVEFVFDIDVDTAGANAGAGDQEDIPVAGSINSPQFSLNMANRRVAVKLILGAAASVGSPIFTDLRTNPTPSTAGANAGEGVNATNA
jgi:hypothetical protein